MQGLRLWVDIEEHLLVEEHQRHSRTAVEEVTMEDSRCNSMGVAHCNHREGDHRTMVAVAVTWMPRVTTRSLDEL